MRPLVGVLALATALLAGAAAPAAAGSTVVDVPAADARTSDVPATDAPVTAAAGGMVLTAHFDGRGNDREVLWANREYPNLAWDHFNDQISWVYNYDSRNWCLYEHAYFQGARVVVVPGGSGNLTGFWNDRVSSLRPC